MDIINKPEWILKHVAFPSDVPHEAVDRSGVQAFVAQCAAAIHRAGYKATLRSAELRYNWKNLGNGRLFAGWPEVFSGVRGACALWSDTALQAASAAGAFLDMYQVHYYQGGGSQYVSSGKPVLVGDIGEHLAGLAEWAAPRAGMFLWLRLAGPVLSADEIMAALKLEKVVVVPGRYCSCEGLRPGQPCPFVRISFASAPLGDLRAGMARLGRMLRAMCVADGVPQAIQGP